MIARQQGSERTGGWFTQMSFLIEKRFSRFSLKRSYIVRIAQLLRDDHKFLREYYVGSVLKKLGKRAYAEETTEGC